VEPGQVVTGLPLNEQLRAARLRVGLSVAEVARRANTSRAAIHAYESGTVSPSLDTAQRILAAMGYALTVSPLATPGAALRHGTPAHRSGPR